MSEINTINENIHSIKIPYKDIFTTIYTLKTPKGTLLFDTGSFDEDIPNYIIPMLSELGVENEDLKYVFISHNHKDHAGGLNELLNHFPSLTVLSRCPKLKEKYGERVISFSDGDEILDCISLVTIPGHTMDSSAVYDKRTKTLISGDCLQLYGIFGSGLWASNINYPTDHLEALKKLRSMNIEKVCTAHDYHPLGQIYTGKADVIKAIDSCIEPLDIISKLIDENDKLNDEEIAAVYNSKGNLPTLGAHVVTAIRKMKEENKMKKLCKIKEGKKLCGVCMGLARYFDIDVTLVRLALVAFTVLGGSGILAYIVAAIVMPEEI